jgi:hypothetical protein
VGSSSKALRCESRFSSRWDVAICTVLLDARREGLRGMELVRIRVQGLS